MSLSLSQRLQALANTYKQTLNLIQDLQRFPNAAVFSGVDPDEKRVELANEIHQSLKEQEDSLEVLRQEFDEDVPSTRRALSTREEERERNAGILSRLSEDIKGARAAFRRAQLQAKRNADAAKRKEREQLFESRARSEEQPSKKNQRLTQDQMALDAAQSVTDGLNRSIQLMSANLIQSQFAIETLEESQAALKDLGESYGTMSDALKSTRGLVNTLMRSQKSDTWYLISSTYILFATLAWLVFRRLLYGPLWWLVYQPLRLLWWTTFATLGAAGFGFSGQASNSSTALSVSHVPTSRAIEFASKEIPAKGGGWGGPHQPQADPPQSPEMVAEVQKIIDNTISGDVGRPSDEAAPSNTKKRMMELEKEQERLRDEL